MKDQSQPVNGSYMISCPRKLHPDSYDGTALGAATPGATYGGYVFTHNYGLLAS